MTPNVCRSSAKLRPNSHVAEPNRAEHWAEFFGRTSASAELWPISTLHQTPNILHHFSVGHPKNADGAPLKTRHWTSHYSNVKCTGAPVFLFFRGWGRIKKSLCAVFCACFPLCLIWKLQNLPHIWYNPSPREVGAANEPAVVDLKHC